MGGGSSGGGQPYDLLGGQYASFSGGTPGFDYGALGAGVGKGLQQFGSSMQNQPVPNYMSGAPSMSQANIEGGSQQTNLVPETNKTSDLMEVLSRILNQTKLSSGAESSNLRQLWNWEPRQLPTELLQPDFTPYMGMV